MLQLKRRFLRNYGEFKSEVLAIIFGKQYKFPFTRESEIARTFLLK